MQLAALDDRSPLVEEADEGAQETGLALTALTEQDEIVSGQQRALELGPNGVLDPDDAGERVDASPEMRLSRSSSLTVRYSCPEARRAPRVRGRSAGASMRG